MSKAEHAYIQIKRQGETWEAGVTYVIHHYRLPDGRAAICIEICTVDCEKHFSDSVVKAALVRHLKSN